jgi:predicted hydrocarbon binding protein
VVLLGVEDVVGRNGMSAILRGANLPQYIDNYPPSNTEYGGHQLRFMAQVNHALYDIYGARGARAILNRIGRGRAKNAIEENATFANAVKLLVSPLPRRMKVKLSLEKISKEYSQQMGTHVYISEDDDHFFWDDTNCAACVDWVSESPVCFTTAGFIFGVIAWGLGDEDFQVKEVACRAKGDATCRYQVNVHG